jgi:hypothetical protein
MQYLLRIEEVDGTSDRIMDGVEATLKELKAVTQKPLKDDTIALDIVSALVDRWILTIWYLDYLAELIIVNWAANPYGRIWSR